MKKGISFKFLLCLLSTIFILSFSFKAQEIHAEELTKNILHTDVTTQRGEMNKTYYEGNEWGSNGSNHWGNDGDFFEVVFTGDKFSLYGNKNNTNGKAKVFLDDVELTEIDYNGVKQSNVLLYTKDNLEQGKHTVRVQAIGWVNHVSLLVSTKAEKNYRQWIKQYENFDALNYTNETWVAFEDVLNESRLIVEDESSTDEALIVAKEKTKLAAKELVMVSGLKQIVAEYKNRNQADYTPESWQKFQSSLNSAQIDMNKESLTKEEVVFYKNQLQNSASTLETLSEGEFLSINNNNFWHDTDGNPIFSQGGGIFKFGDTYYWYGVRYVEALDYYNNPTKYYNPNSPIFYSITCYSSKDLVNWKFENDIATQDTKVFIDPSLDVSEDYFSRMQTLKDASWIGRLGVTYNEKTGKYTLLTQMENKFDPVRETNASVMFLQGDSPTGKFEYANIQTQIENAPVQGTGDQTVFTDDNGEDYLILSGRNGRKHTLVSKISDEDSLSLEPGVQIGYVGSGREGNAMFKLDDRYHAASSALHGWNTSETYLISSKTDNIQGAYSNGYVLSGSEKDYSHVTQAGFFVTVKGTKGTTVVYCGDRWADFAWNGLGYNQWVPISNKEDNLYFNSFSDWQLNATTGEWQLDDKNNFILNPEFAADRIIVNKLVGWENKIAENSPNFVSNVTPGANGTRFALQLGAESAYEGLITQENEVPKGVYQFKLDINNATLLDTAQVVIEGNENEKYVLPINEVTSSWQTLSFENLKLTSGVAKVSIEVKSSTGNQYIKVDNLHLVKQSQLIDKTKLETILSESEEYLSSNLYTEASLEILRTTVAEGKTLLATENSLQIEIDEATEKIRIAISSLEKINTEVLPNSIELNVKGVKSVKLGNQIELGVIFNPVESTDKTIKWVVEDPNIASVDENNVLVTTKVGVTRVTAETVNGKKATLTIRVTK